MVTILDTFSVNVDVEWKVTTTSNAPVDVQPDPLLVHSDGGPSD